MDKILETVPVFLSENFLTDYMPYNQFKKTFSNLVDFQYLERSKHLKFFLASNKKNLVINWFSLYNSSVSIHSHDFDTLIFACYGSCTVVGENSFTFVERDTRVIGKNVKHGFISRSSTLFGGLSIRSADGSDCASA